ncbi:MAG: ribose-phosphate diphosphokinase [Bacteroidota bacterium]|nr:ribose-phosphate diphosphokinase [Bacteroidota bacterium]
MKSYSARNGATSIHQNENAEVHADPILFAFPAYTYISKPLSALPDVIKGRFQARRFPNGELHLDLDSFRPEEDCVIIGTIAPPEKNLFSILLLAHTLKKERARKVTAILPYLSESRQDRSEPGKSFATPLIGRLLKIAGVDEVLTVDVHSLESLTLFPVPLRSLSPATIFADEIIRLGMDDATILAPDEGALPRVKDVAARIGPEAQIASMRKKRSNGGISHSDISGTIGKRVVIIDDILDTGSTLISCCKVLCSHGVGEIVIMVTHGLFTGQEWKELWDLNVKFIYCTDTLPPESYPVSKNIRLLSIIALLTEEIRKAESTRFLSAEEEEEEAYDYDLSPW